MRSVLFVTLVVVGAIFGALCRGAVADDAQPDAKAQERAAFAEAFAARAKKELPEAKVTVKGDLEVGVKGEGGESTVFLDNDWKLYQLKSTEEARERIFGDHIATLKESMKDGAKEMVDIKNVLPVVRAGDFAKDMEVSGAKVEMVSEPFAGDLSVMYVEDREKSVRYLRPDELKTLGLDLAALRGKALENLKAKQKTAKWKDAGDLHMLIVDGMSEASFLLLDDFWKDMAPKVEGDIVALVAARDLVIVTGSKSAGLEKLRNMDPTKLAALDHPISQSLYVRKDGVWKKMESLKK